MVIYGRVAAGKIPLNSDKFSMAVQQQEVMRRKGLPSLCVLIFPNTTPGLAFLLSIQSDERAKRPLE